MRGEPTDGLAFISPRQLRAARVIGSPKQSGYRCIWHTATSPVSVRSRTVQVRFYGTKFEKTVRLASGDVCALTGPARLARHGIDRVIAGSSTLVPGGRPDQSDPPPGALASRQS